MSLREDSSADLKARLAELGLQVTIGKKSIEATMKLTSIAGIGAKEIGQKTVAKIEIPIRHRRHLERTARLSYLAPDIVLAILDGKQPSHLSARKLVRAASLPLDWSAQRQMLLAR